MISKLSGFVFHYRGKTPCNPSDSPGILIFRMVKCWQLVVEVKYWQYWSLMQGLFAESGMETKSSLYPTEKKEVLCLGE